MAVRRRFDGRRSPRRGEHPADEIEALLGAVGDKDLLGPDGNAVALHAPGQGFPQGRESGPLPVSEQCGSVLFQGPVQAAAKAFQGKEPMVHLQAAEIDRPRVPDRPGRVIAVKIPERGVGGPRGQGFPVRSRRRRAVGRSGQDGPLADARTGPGPQVEEAQSPKLLIGQADCRSMQAELGGQSAGGREHVAGNQDAVSDLLPDLVDDLAEQRPAASFVELQKQHGVLPGNESGSGYSRSGLSATARIY
jgi:hypothetical protein